jgi:predicted nucleotidyltransferase
MSAEKSITNAMYYFAQEHGITPLEARDFGSRACGLADEDSDRDILFIFKQPPKNHIYYDQSIDSICTDYDGYDYQGWSLRKFCDELLDNDPMAIEFLSSNLEYYSHTITANARFRELANDMAQAFNRMGLYYHYRSLANGNYNQYIKNGNHPTIKRLTQIYWAMARADFIRKQDQLPPIRFKQFLAADANTIHDEDRIDREIRDRFHELAERKRAGKGDEFADTEGDGTIIENFCEQEADHNELTTTGISKERLNEFQATIRGDEL